MNNPSPISITVGDVTLRVTYQGYDIGPAIISNLVAVPGANTYTADFQLTPTADSAQQSVVASVLSGYLMQKTFDFQVVGNTDSTTVDSLKEGFAGLNLKTTLTGIPPTLVTTSAMYNFGATFPCPVTICAQVLFVIQNSIDTGFSIESVNANVWWTPPADANLTTGTETLFIGTVSSTLSPPMFVGAHESATSPLLPIVLDYDTLAIIEGYIVAIYNTPSHFMYVRMQQNASITVGDDGSFHGVLEYEQDNVPVDLSNFAFPYTPSAVVAAANISSSANIISSMALSTALPGSSSTPSASIIPSAPITSTATTTSSPDTTITTTMTTTSTELATTPTETLSTTTTTGASLNTAIASSGGNDANSTSA